MSLSRYGWNAFTGQLDLLSNVTGGGLITVEVTGTSQAMAVNTAYIANNAGLVSLSLPTTAAQGSLIEVWGKGAGLYQITQAASQQIVSTAGNTTLGATGTFTSLGQYNVVRLKCITADNIWSVHVDGSFTPA